MLLNKLKRRWRALIHRDELEYELDEELRFHLERDIALNLESGMSPEEARYAAMRSFGGVDQSKEECRDARGVSFIENFLLDLRYGGRMLLKNPGFTLIAILTLALGIGANTAIFSVVNATLLRPLPYNKPEQLVMVWGTNPAGFGWHGKTGFSAPSFLDYQQQNQVFERLATFTSADYTLVGTDNPEAIRGGMVTPQFLELLGVQPVLGRTFAADDAQAGKDHVVMLSYNLWQRRFGSNLNVIGQMIRLDADSYTVVGVLPRGFDFAIPDYFESRDLWLPAVLSADSSERARKYLTVIGRLKPGVALSQADQDMRLITERLDREYPASMTGFGVRLIPLHEQIVGDIRPALLVLFGAVGFLLLIACANVANLQLARTSARQREIAIRTALGASRGRVLRQLLTESILLGLIGGALGLPLALAGTGLLTRLGPQNTPGATLSTVDLKVLAYTLAISLITGILFGLAPAIHSAPTRLGESLKDGGKSSASNEGGLRLRKVLMVSEVALSMILLIGAGLLIRSFVSLLQVSPGFDSTNVLTADFDLPRYAYADDAKQTAFYAQIIERVKGLPGVVAVGVTDELPPTMGTHSNTFSIDGRPPIDQKDQSLAVQDRVVSPDYFRVMGIPLITGRLFSTGDASAPPTALVNQNFAHRFFPNENPIGQRLRFESSNSWITIVGTVGDVRGFGLDKQPRSEIYLFYQQKPLPYHPLSHLHLVVRTASDPRAIAKPLMALVRELDKDLPLPQARTMETVVAASVATRRFNTLLLGAFGVVALLLTGVGIYGVISYSVAQRVPEIGIRIALGAQPRNVIALVVRNAMTLALIGIALGLAGAFTLTRWMSSLLFEIGARDGATFVSTALLLGSIALLASWVPARRAARVDPLIALRYE